MGQDRLAVILAGIFFVLCIACLVYFIRRENRLLKRIQKMLDDAIAGRFQDKHLDESKISAIENSMWRYLCDHNVAYGNLLAEKGQMQELISDISHQAVLPIANIMLYAQLIEETMDFEQDGRESEAKEEIAAIRQEAQELDFLMESLVKLSRLETGIIHVNVQKQSIRPILTAIQNQFMAKAEQKNICFTVKDAEELAVFDLKWTIEAIANVVDNAIKYTPCGGEVTVRAAAYTFFVRIDVKDNGIGIEETEQANIFTRFYRSPAVSKEPGVGIGLYLAREVMSAQDGYIKLSSKAGAGSVFSLFLPKEEMAQK